MSTLALKIVQALDLCSAEREKIAIQQAKERLTVEILHQQETLAEYNKGNYYPEHLLERNGWQRRDLLEDQEEQRKMHAVSCLIRKSRDWRHKI